MGSTRHMRLWRGPPPSPGLEPFTHQDECPSPLHNICTWHPGHSTVLEGRKFGLLILLPKMKGAKI